VTGRTPVSQRVEDQSVVPRGPLKSGMLTSLHWILGTPQVKRKDASVGAGVMNALWPSQQIVAFLKIDCRIGMLPPSLCTSRHRRVLSTEVPTGHRSWERHGGSVLRHDQTLTLDSWPSDCLTMIDLSMAHVPKERRKFTQPSHDRTLSRTFHATHLAEQWREIAADGHQPQSC
jgi:hypothetical protein